MSLYLALFTPLGLFGLSLLSKRFPFSFATPEDQPEEAEDQLEEDEDQPDEAENDGVQEFKEALLSHQGDIGYVVFLRFPNRRTGCLKRIDIGILPFNAPFTEVKRIALYQFRRK